MSVFVECFAFACPRFDLQQTPKVSAHLPMCRPRWAEWWALCADAANAGAISSGGNADERFAPQLPRERFVAFGLPERHNVAT